MPNHIDIDVVWGGYYACISREKATISVFRIIDFNKDAYHVTLFEEDFDQMPTSENIEALSPFIQHVPFSIDGLFNYDEITLVSRKPLTTKDLTGYQYYLKEMGMHEEAWDEFSEALLGFSSDPPLPLRVTPVDEEVRVEIRS